MVKRSMFLGFFFITFYHTQKSLSQSDRQVEHSSTSEEVVGWGGGGLGFPYLCPLLYTL